jgi:PAS domain S-box-containing protein
VERVTAEKRDGFLRQVASPAFCERLFAQLPDVVFCLKDAQRRYQAANAAFAQRLGLSDPRKLLGRTAEDFFPDALARVYRAQDEHVLRSGAEMTGRLELVTNRDGSLGWYLATKVPLHDAAGRVIGFNVCWRASTTTLARRSIRTNSPRWAGFPWPSSTAACAACSS